MSKLCSHKLDGFSLLEVKDKGCKKEQIFKRVFWPKITTSSYMSENQVQIVIDLRNASIDSNKIYRLNSFFFNSAVLQLEIESSITLKVRQVMKNNDMTQPHEVMRNNSC